MKNAILVLAGLSLGACATPIPPSKSTQDFLDVEAEHTRLDALSVLDAAPTGSASYEGAVSGSFTGDVDGSFLGDLAMTIDFADPTNGVGGSISSVTLYDGSQPDQDLGGSLSIAGGYDGGLNATATGTVTAVGEDGGFSLEGSADLSLSMTGDVFDDGGNNVVAGSITGGSTNDEDDIYLRIDTANFYASEL